MRVAGPQCLPSVGCPGILVRDEGGELPLRRDHVPIRDGTWIEVSDQEGCNLYQSRWLFGKHLAYPVPWVWEGVNADCEPGALQPLQAHDPGVFPGGCCCQRALKIHLRKPPRGGRSENDAQTAMRAVVLLPSNIGATEVLLPASEPDAAPQCAGCELKSGNLATDARVCPECVEGGDV